MFLNTLDSRFYFIIFFLRVRKMVKHEDSEEIKGLSIIFVFIFFLVLFIFI